MTMSSFLMNSNPYAEPKFPPTEEYSQNNYIPSGHNEEYYRSMGYGAYDRRYQDSYSAGSHMPPYGGTPGPGITPGIPVSGTGPPPAHMNMENPTPAHQNSYSSPPNSYSSPPPPPHSDSPGSVPSPTPPSSGQTQCQSSSSTPPVIYPWMKRIHVGSQGTYILPFTNLLLSLL